MFLRIYYVYKYIFRLCYVFVAKASKLDSTELWASTLVVFKERNMNARSSPIYPARFK